VLAQDVLQGVVDGVQQVGARVAVQGESPARASASTAAWAASCSASSKASRFMALVLRVHARGVSTAARIQRLGA
jgi:hypothetical protein